MFGADVLGGDFDLSSVASFIPALAVVNSLAGGKKSEDKKTAGGSGVGGGGVGATAEPSPTGKDVRRAVQDALAQQKLREQKEKAEASARHTRYALYAALGVVGL